MGSLKYFVFNKKRDYEAGYLEHIRIAAQGIALHTEEALDQGVFISRLMDSRQEGNQWHRAVIQSLDYGDDSIRFYFYCSDESQVAIDGKIWELTDLIRSDVFGTKEKHRIMQPFLAHKILNPKDVLLYHAKGRFLWFEVHLFSRAGRMPEIWHMKIYAEHNSFIRYLPEIYRTEDRNGFLRRYLSLFEAVYQDLDENIRAAARQQDPRSASPEFLQWMAGWVGITDACLWPEDKLRALIKSFVRQNLVRGTRAYMEWLIETFTGEKPFFVEYAEIEGYRGSPVAYRRLRQYYAHGPYDVNILVRECASPTTREQQALMRVIEDAKPAWIEVHLIILRPYIYLNQNVYVGINSALGTYRKACLDGLAAIPSIIERTNTGGDREEP